MHTEMDTQRYGEKKDFYLRTFLHRIFIDLKRKNSKFTLIDLTDTTLVC